MNIYIKIILTYNKTHGTTIVGGGESLLAEEGAAS
jgi:hypothetical protein